MKYSPTTRGWYSEDVHGEDGIPTDAVDVPEGRYFELLGHVIEPGPDGFPVIVEPAQLLIPERIAMLRAAVQDHLDAAARAMGYDDIKTAVTYADEPAVPKFQTEGQALRVWRSRVWARCYEILDQWNAGALSEPTAEELIADLPLLAVPA